MLNEEEIFYFYYLSIFRVRVLYGLILILEKVPRVLIYLYNDVED